MTPTTPPPFHPSQISITPTSADNYSSSIHTDNEDDFPEPIHTLLHGATLKVPDPESRTMKRRSKGMLSTISDRQSRGALRDSPRDAGQAVTRRFRSASESSVLLPGQLDRNTQQQLSSVDTPDTAPARRSILLGQMGLYVPNSVSSRASGDAILQSQTTTLPSTHSFAPQVANRVDSPQSVATNLDAMQGAFGSSGSTDFVSPLSAVMPNESQFTQHTLSQPSQHQNPLPASTHTNLRVITSSSTTEQSPPRHTENIAPKPEIRIVTKRIITKQPAITNPNTQNTTYTTKTLIMPQSRSSDDNSSENHELQSIDEENMTVQLDGAMESDTTISNQQEATEQLRTHKDAKKERKHVEPVSKTAVVRQEQVLLVEEPELTESTPGASPMVNSQVLTPISMEHITPYTASTEHHSTFAPASGLVQRSIVRDPQRTVEVRRVRYVDEQQEVVPQETIIRTIEEGEPNPDVTNLLDPYSAALPAETEPIIKLENIQKTYLLGIEGVPALRGVSLEIMRGEFVIVYGTSGGGKTSLLNIIGTIDKATKGRIQIGSSQVREQTKDSQLANIRLKKIGFVFQTFNLLGTMTALENVEMPMILRGKLSRSARRKRAKELLAQVGMAERIHHKPAQMSGGEQQRVTIARAIANEPEIMILDEPTGDLDTHNTRLVMNLLQRLNREQKITMVMVTHDPGLKNAADRVIRMRDGKVAGIEIVTEEARSNFWTDLKQRMPTHVSDEAHGDVKRDSLRRNTEIREPHNYAFFRGCLPEARAVAEEMLQDCIARSRPGYGTTSVRGSLRSSTRTPTVPQSATTSSTTLTRRSRRTVYDDDSPTPGTPFPPGANVTRIIRTVGGPEQGGDHVTIRIDDA